MIDAADGPNRGRELRTQIGVMAATKLPHDSKGRGLLTTTKAKPSGQTPIHATGDRKAGPGLTYLEV